MASIEKFKTTDNYDPLHTLLNRPLNEIEDLITAQEIAVGGLVDREGLGRRLVSDGVPLGANFAPNDSPVVERRGDNVSISVSIRVTTANHIVGITQRNVGTVPLGFRPQSTRFLTARSPAPAGTASVEIRPNGEIYMRGYSLATHSNTLLIEFSDAYPGVGGYIGA